MIVFPVTKTLSVDTNVLVLLGTELYHKQLNPNIDRMELWCPGLARVDVVGSNPTRSDCGFNGFVPDNNPCTICLSRAYRYCWLQFK